MNFQDFKLNAQLVNAITDMGWSEPTEIQKKAIPLVLNGQDVIGIAQTGTGKTAAYMLPLLRKLNYAQIDQPRALILAPTKELIVQVKEQVEELTTYTDLRCTALYGGVGAKAQMQEIEAGIDIIIATPGRFMDLYLKGAIPVKQIKTMVLDEADRLMDMGFMPQIRKILEVVPVKRQNLLFSATFPEKVEELAGEFLDFPTRIEVTPQATAATTIEQLAYAVENERTKLNLLVHLLKDEALNKVIVFTNSKKTADSIAKHLDRKVEGEFRVVHSNKGQNSRINAVREFEEGLIRVLVATNVSARGIDIADVTHVVNFELPFAYEEYVHRIGRTGRAFKKGVAISFTNMAEKYHLKKIEEVIQGKIERVPIPEAVEIIKTGRGEQIEIERELDKIKRRENPDFKGAFHEKKRKFSTKETKSKKNKNRKRR